MLWRFEKCLIKIIKSRLMEEVKYTAKELGILGVNALANVVIIIWQFPFSVRVLRMD